MERTTTPTHLINCTLSLSGTPGITFLKAGGREHSVPSANANSNGGFTLHFETGFAYEALSNVLATYLKGKRFQLSEGLISKHIIIENGSIAPQGDQLAITLQFSGSFSGTVFLTGVPFYNPTLQTISLKHVQYDLKSSSFLLTGAKWLFNKIILDEIQKYTVADITPLYNKATAALNELLNKEWTTGLQAMGRVDAIEVTRIEALPQQLVLRCRCTGSLHLILNESALKLSI